MEQVILVDDKNRRIGVCPKETVHTQNTPLHRAFSVFLFNSNHELLLTKRAATKKTFAGVWTNSVCGHVSPGEKTFLSAKRRTQEELGIAPHAIRKVSPYRYSFKDANGIVENEICPIYVGYAAMDPKPNKKEVEDWKWIAWDEFLSQIQSHPGSYSPWCEEEAMILRSRDIFNR